MADNYTIARPYAQAVFDVAREQNALSELSASLQVGKALMSNGRVEAFLGNPSLHDGQRLEFLQGLFATAAGTDSVFAGSNKHGNNFLKLLLEYGRIGVLPEISDQFETLKAQVENSIEVTVTSASPISDSQRSAIATALQKRFGREVVLTAEVNEQLIGGAVIRAGDVVIDGSLRARLEGLANALVA